MEQFKHLDAKTIELAGIAVSLAGGCRPCLDYHFKKALEIGCTIEEAEEAVELVRKEVKDKYPETIDVKFYNVLLPENQDMMKYFGIAAIPTQVLMDSNGKEAFRHTGYFSFAELEKEFQKIKL